MIKIAPKMCFCIVFVMFQGVCGGFKDREENVEKKDWNSDDEEYDEFGRKKKKKMKLPAGEKYACD